MSKAWSLSHSREPTRWQGLWELLSQNRQSLFFIRRQCQEAHSWMSRFPLYVTTQAAPQEMCLDPQQPPGWRGAAWEPGDKPSLGSIVNPLLIRRAVTNNTNCFAPFKVLYGIRYSTDNNELVTESWLFLLPRCTENLAKSSIRLAPTWETHGPRLVNRHKKGCSSVEDQDSVLLLDSIDISTIYQTDCLEDLALSICF